MEAEKPQGYSCTTIFSMVTLMMLRHADILRHPVDRSICICALFLLKVNLSVYILYTISRRKKSVLSAQPHTECKNAQVVGVDFRELRQRQRVFPLPCFNGIARAVELLKEPVLVPRK